MTGIIIGLLLLSYANAMHLSFPCRSYSDHCYLATWLYP